MENEKAEISKKKSVKNYLKKYSYYIALAALVIFLAIAIVITSTLSNKQEEDTVPTSAGVITFTSPVLNGTVLKGYSDTELQYNKTLKLWEVHKAVDFVAEIGTDVLAAYDGTVTSVSTNLLVGTVVEINHGNGLKTTYGDNSYFMVVAFVVLIMEVSNFISSSLSFFIDLYSVSVRYSVE